MTNGESSLQMHSPVGLKRKQKPYENQHNNMKDLNDNHEHNTKVLESIIMHNIIITERHLTDTYKHQLYGSNEMWTVVEATC